MNLTFLWTQYLVLAIVIMISGSRLVKDAEIIAEKTKLGGTLVGILLLSVITSLPELFNGMGAVLFAKEPDLTVGDVVGSLLINLVIFAAVSFFLKKEQWKTLGTNSLLLSGVLSVGLTGVYVVCHWLAARGIGFDIGWVSGYSFVILTAYFLAIYFLYRFEKNHQALAGETFSDETMDFGRAVRDFSLNSIVVVAAGTYLPVVAGSIAEISGMTNSFMGFIFLAIATSLPELVVVSQAVRLGLIHMALGDVFGSNLFDIAILSFDDFLYFTGSLFTNASIALTIGACVSIIITVLILIGLKMKIFQRVFGLVRVLTFLVLGLYFLAIILMYRFT